MTTPGRRGLPLGLHGARRLQQVEAVRIVNRPGRSSVLSGMRRLLPVLLLLLVPAEALAGYCLSEAERERATQTRADAAPGRRRQAERDDQARSRTSKVAEAIRAALASVPAGLSYRALRGKVRAALGQCSDTALDAALAELGDEVLTTDGPRGATIHTLVEEAAA